MPTTTQTQTGSANGTATTVTMATLRFGVEIETVGASREACAQAIQAVVGGTIGYEQSYGAHTVTAPDGRVWKAVRDGSLSSQTSAEMVSPICTAADIPAIQEIVREIRRRGGRADASCGIHVHIDAAPFTTRAVCNLVRMIYRQEEIIEAALQIAPHRRARFCRSIRRDFLAAISREGADGMSMDALNGVWYGRQNRYPMHYDETRYHGVNLHSIWYRGTIEFRWFNGTTHAGRVKSYIQFCLALGHRALQAHAVLAHRRAYSETTAHADMRSFLCHLGLNGTAYETARHHLLAHLRATTDEAAEPAIIEAEAAPASMRSRPAVRTGRRQRVARVLGRDPRLPAPGTMLVREFGGRRYEVIVRNVLFILRDEVHVERTFRSLSAAARAITGVSTNGFRFFGLTGRNGGTTAARPAAHTEA